MIGAVAYALSLGAASFATPAQVTLAASPAHVALAAGSRQAVRITATGGAPLTVEARVAGFGLDLRGRPKIAATGDGAAWVFVTPPKVRVGRFGGVLVVTARRPARTRPGDHTALVLLSAVAPSARGVVVRMRIGLVVSVRAPGRIVHRVAIVAARARRAGAGRLLDVTIANRGNVIETIGAGRLTVTLVGSGGIVARYRAGRRELLPRARGLVRFRVRGGIRGVLTARVELQRTARHWVVRRFRLRL